MCWNPRPDTGLRLLNGNPLPTNQRTSSPPSKAISRVVFLALITSSPKPSKLPRRRRRHFHFRWGGGLLLELRRASNHTQRRSLSLSPSSFGTEIGIQFHPASIWSTHLISGIRAVRPQPVRIHTNQGVEDPIPNLMDNSPEKVGSWDEREQSLYSYDQFWVLILTMVSPWKRKKREEVWLLKLVCQIWLWGAASKY